MNIDDRFGKLQMWAFEKHNEETLLAIRGMKNLTFDGFDGYFLEVWRDHILEYLESVRKRTEYFFEKQQGSGDAHEKRRYAKIIIRIFKKGYQDIQGVINSMVVYANDQDSLGPLPA